MAYGGSSGIVSATTDFVCSAGQCLWTVIIN